MLQFRLLWLRTQIQLQILAPVLHLLSHRLSHSLLLVLKLLFLWAVSVLPRTGSDINGCMYSFMESIAFIDRWFRMKRIWTGLAWTIQGASCLVLLHSLGEPRLQHKSRPLYKSSSLSRQMNEVANQSQPGLYLITTFS